MTRLRLQISALCGASLRDGSAASRAPRPVAPPPRSLGLQRKRNSFGSCQERKIFPFHHAPDRLGNQLVPILGDPYRGPGSYNNDERSSMVYALTHKPESTKGYILGARTSLRFPPDCKVRKALSTVRHGCCMFLWVIKKMNALYEILCSSSFRPGTYEADKLPHKKITWPMKFGSPDWSLVPMPERRTLRTELITDKEFRKHRNRLAYLSLYYS
uniref:Ciliary microtubule associated protein 3 n=1 Tax=Chelonoidis abingdonii TaxID=106734 RepID=A0A8C0GTI5_CHEAB